MSSSSLYLPYCVTWKLAPFVPAHLEALDRLVGVLGRHAQDPHVLPKPLLNYILIFKLILWSGSFEIPKTA
jgi:hypothetical protein